MTRNKTIRTIILSAIMICAIFAIFGMPGGENVVYAQTASGLTDGTAGRIFSFFSELFFKLSGTLLALTGWVLDESIKFSLNTENFAMDAVERGWTVLRDIANITFIFILLYIAMATILRIGGINTKQLLVNVVIIAFLINFSLFFTQIVIDASNILAAFFYNNATSITLDEKQSNLGEIFTAALKPETLFDRTQYPEMNYAKTGVSFLLGAIAILLAAFSFFAVAIMFIVRTAALIILMVLSPLAFAAYILDDFRQYFTKWWNTLLNQSFFAPAYFLIIYIVLLIILSPQFNSAIGDRNLAAGINAVTKGFTPAEIGSLPGNELSMLSVFFSYVLIIFLINGALVVAKQMGGATAALGNKWAGKGLGLAMGGMAFAGRRTFGRGFSALSKSEKLKDAAAKGGLGGMAARFALRGSGGLAKSTFDVRGGKVGAALSAGAGVIGTDFDKARGGGGYEAVIKEKTQRKVELGKTFVETQKSDAERDWERKQRDKKRELDAAEKTLRQKTQSDPKLKESIEELAKQIKNIESGKETAHPDILKGLKESLAQKDEGVSQRTQELADINIRLQTSATERKATGIRRAESFAEKLDEGSNEINRAAANEIRRALNQKPEQKLQDDLIKAIKGIKKDE